MYNLCARLHNSVAKLERFDHSFEPREIPLNGIYFVFEKEESGHEVDRIVRIGTHTGRDNLPHRLEEHFKRENKDRSVFRKNIGRAILWKRSDSFLVNWNKDLTSRKAKQEYGAFIDPKKQSQVENKVSSYMKHNLSFAVIPLEEKLKRLELEAKMISTVSHCDRCHPSEDWLGLYSPVWAIRKSGLWLTQHLNGSIVTSEDLDFILSYSK